MMQKCIVYRLSIKLLENGENLTIVKNRIYLFNFVSMILPELELSKIKIKLFKSKQEAFEWLSI